MIKGLKKVYSWSAFARTVEEHTVRQVRKDSFVRDSGISGQVMRWSELDAPLKPYPCGMYYSTKLGAVEGFILRSRARLHELLRTREELDPDVQEYRRIIDEAHVERFALGGKGPIPEPKS